MRLIEITYEYYDYDYDDVDREYGKTLRKESTTYINLDQIVSVDKDSETIAMSNGKAYTVSSSTMRKIFELNE